MKAEEAKTKKCPLKFLGQATVITECCGDGCMAWHPEKEHCVIIRLMRFHQ